MENKLKNSSEEEIAISILEVEGSQNIVDYEEKNIYENKNNDFLYAVSKRLFDVVFSILCLILLSPVLFLFFILIKIEEPKNKAIYNQYRYGLNGKRFKMFKFRSMVFNAELKLRENELLYKKYLDNNYKLELIEDPRITKIGAFIRKYSIDEIPQFFNVLMGDMSIVGPRPIVDEELEIEYGTNKNKFLSVKPGITGYWQANGRSNVGYPKRKDMEFYYIENKSLTMDFKIIISTVKSVINKTGAY